MTKALYVIGIDTGGTFTDFVLFSMADHKLHSWKYPTTPEDPSLGIITGIKQLMARFHFASSDISLILHGTTIGTNAFLEGKIPSIAFITTKGFKDIIEIARQQRSDLYNLKFTEHYPLSFDRDAIIEAEERIDSEGNVILPLNIESIASSDSLLFNKHIHTIAISLLFSFLNPVHEKLLVEHYQSKGFDVYNSYELVPQIREYERSVTTIINAKISPIVREYLSRLEQRLHDINITAPLLIMQSNTGLSNVENIASQGIHTLYSGLAAGVLAASASAQHLQIRNIISLDIGGTSTDVSAFSSNPVILKNKIFHGFPLIVPVVDVETIGAGGGSIASFTEGLLKVGPESQGANPGPACYSLGGDKPTLTDANLLLGYLHKDNFAGNLNIDVSKAEAVLRTLFETIKTADIPIDVSSIVDLAYAIRKILNHNIALAIRKVTIQRGLDPRDFTLVAFGGAGPLHGWDVAQELSIPKVIIPPYPGVWSAFGLICSDIRHTKTLTWIQDLEQLNLERINNKLSEITKELKNILLTEDINLDRQEFRYYFDIRYIGQAYCLTLPISYPLTNERLIKTISEFHKLHKQNYAWFDTSLPIEIVNITVEAIGKMPKIVFDKLPTGTERVAEEAFEGERMIYSNNEWVTAPVISKDKLKAGNIVLGPAVINQLDTTVFVPDNVRAHVDKFGYLLLEESK